MQIVFIMSVQILSRLHFLFLHIYEKGLISSVMNIEAERRNIQTGDSLSKENIIPYLDKTTDGFMAPSGEATYAENKLATVCVVDEEMNHLQKKKKQFQIGKKNY